MNDLFEKNDLFDGIQYFFVDAEGSEYKLLPIISSPTYPKQFCQVSLELHGRFERYGLNEIRYSNLLREFFLKSPYLPVWFYGGGNTRAFFINGFNSDCAEKFFLLQNDDVCD